MIYNFEQGFGNISSSPRPIVAISANIIGETSTLHFAYSQAIVDAGAVPLIVPANCTPEALAALCGSVDALLLSGGDDIDARYFGEENIPGLTELNLQRDYYEFALLRVAIDRGLPILGICRGCQVINVALGGSIYQDLPTQYPTPPLPHSILTDRHLPAHKITISEGSLLHKIVGSREFAVNSRHHQALKAIAPTLTATAHSEDGVVEAIEGHPTSRILALQWHPENMATTGCNREMQQIFAHFVGEAELYRQAKAIHALNPIVDSHCDTPMLYDQGGFDFALRSPQAKVDIVKMDEGRLDSTITVAYIPQSTSRKQATKKAIDTLRRFKGDIAKIEGKITVAKSASEVLRAKSMGQKSVMLGIENGLAIGDLLDNIDLFKGEGVVYITLCHNGSNDICDSAVGDPLHGGVSSFGAEVIARMNALGITIDISHAAEQSVADALRLSSQPIIASHSSCRALFDHPRNLSDDAICAIAAKGGVVQVCAYHGFLGRDGKATLLDVVAHIEHIIRITESYENVGIGSDFDGGGGVIGLDGANDFLGITIELLRRGHTPENIAKVMGGNILRVISQNSNY